MRNGGRVALLAAGLMVSFGGPACGEDPAKVEEPTCLDSPPSLACQPLYGLIDGTISPTFDEVYSNTVSKCAVAGCHDAERRAGGMSLADIDTAYDALLANGANGRPRVVPGDTECGRFIVRLESAGEPWSMPPSGHLSEAALCSLRHWINNGAQR